MPFRNELTQVPEKYMIKCHMCNGVDIWFQCWESSDVAHSEVRYECHNCDHIWWVEGIDI